MWKRVYGVVSLGMFLCAAGCGGGADSSSSSSNTLDTCAAGTMSMPTGMPPADPCPQSGTACANAGMVAVATCGADGHWMKNPAGAITCACVQRTGFTNSGAAGTNGASTCGNGMIEAISGEQCDGIALNNATCASLGLGMGLLSCNPQTCQYDTSMCMQGAGATGMGGSGT